MNWNSLLMQGIIDYTRANVWQIFTRMSVKAKNVKELFTPT